MKDTQVQMFLIEVIEKIMRKILWINFLSTSEYIWIVLELILTQIHLMTPIFYLINNLNSYRIVQNHVIHSFWVCEILSVYKTFLNDYLIDEVFWTWRSHPSANMSLIDFNLLFQIILFFHHFTPQSLPLYHFILTRG